MHPPATVNWTPKIAALVALTLSFVCFETPGTAVKAQSSTSVKSIVPADGTFLFGETPYPNQLSKGYVVFQRQNGKVIGATYSPSSQFDCFTGDLKNNTLAVKSAAVGESKIANVRINLLNLHQIKSVSANDRRIISVCKALG